MQKRDFGKTGLKTSLLGFGGFHLCEIPYSDADLLLNTYLDAGGNYIETAVSYGSGESERKIGKALSHRRDDYILVSKCHLRDNKSYMDSLEKSLNNLKTEYIDVMLMHAVATKEELDKILGPGGAMEAAEKARQQGKIGNIGISMHGQPDTLIDALERYPFDAVMPTINYYDICNFPKLKNTLLPLAKEKGTAVILMKPLADGYLWRNPAPAFHFAFSQPVSVVVTGMNTYEMLKKDLYFAENFIPMTPEEEEKLMQSSPELGDYVCRQCGKCIPCPEGIDIPGLFRLEGLYDRQMVSGKVGNPESYALQERLKSWFGTDKRAKENYAELASGADACTYCGACLPKCPYKIDITRKIKLVGYKLGNDDSRIMDV